MWAYHAGIRKPLFAVTGVTGLRLSIERTQQQVVVVRDGFRLDDCVPWTHAWGKIHLTCWRPLSRANMSATGCQPAPLSPKPCLCISYELLLSERL